MPTDKVKGHIILPFSIKLNGLLSMKEDTLYIPPCLPLMQGCCCSPFQNWPVGRLICTMRLPARPTHLPPIILPCCCTSAPAFNPLFSRLLFSPSGSYSRPNFLLSRNFVCSVLQDLPACLLLASLPSPVDSIVSVRPPSLRPLPFFLPSRQTPD